VDARDGRDMSQRTNVEVVLEHVKITIIIIMHKVVRPSVKNGVWLRVRVASVGKWVRVALLLLMKKRGQALVGGKEGFDMYLPN
jgi:hypothetical protein